MTTEAELPGRSQSDDGAQPPAFSFDVGFDFRSETPPGQDPDKRSPALRRYHQLLWTKPLPTGREFTLDAPSAMRRGYLIHSTDDGHQFYLASDAITNSYSGWVRPRALVEAIASLNEQQRARYLRPPYTIGSAMLWPMRSADRPTMNQARGFRAAIADRMDLTLECIRRHYQGGTASPLASVLAAYGDFFALFGDFQGFVDFFLFQDLVTGDYQQVDFYLPFDGFARSGVPQSVDDYVTYREATLAFITARERRMQEWVTTSKHSVR